MKQYLNRIVGVLCIFTLMAGLWLLAMENILRHQGYGQRSVAAICIICQSLATLWWLNKGPAVLRHLVLFGSLAILWFAAAALWNVNTSGHFEGFAVIIAGALLAQACATFAACSGTILSAPR